MQVNLLILARKLNKMYNFGTGCHNLSLILTLTFVYILKVSILKNLWYNYIANNKLNIRED